MIFVIKNMPVTDAEFLEIPYPKKVKNMVFNPITKERLMSTDEKIASVSASFAMEDMILTPQELSLIHI